MSGQVTKISGAARLAQLLAAAVTAWAFLSLHAMIAAPDAPPLSLLRGPPHPLPPRYGWWAWADQGWYDKSALAWAHGITDWWMHWYLPGYPLLGAIFVRVTPVDPFLIPNLASMLGTLALFCALARHLLGPSPLGIPLCAAIFVATAVLPRQVLTAWVTPWTTTPETFCVYAALLAGAAMIERPRPGAAFLVGLAGGAIAGFRPADCVVVLLVTTAAILPPLLSRGLGRRSLLWPMAAGVALPVLVFGAAYLAVWGPHASGYVTTSGRLGFEPRLLLLLWVNLMVDPGALYPEGQGLAAVFFWTVYRPNSMPPSVCFGLGLLADLLGPEPPGLTAVVLLAVHGTAMRHRVALIRRGFLAVWLSFAAAALVASAAQWVLTAILDLRLLPLFPALLTATLAIGLYPFLSVLLAEAHHSVAAPEQA